MTLLLDLDFKEGSGTISKDKSGEDRTVTLVNTSTWISGGGLTFDSSSSEYCTFGGAVSDFDLDEMTLLIMLNLSSGYAGWDILFGNGAVSTNKGWYLGFDSGTLKGVINDGTNKLHDVYFDGKITNVRIYDRSLNPREIKQLYNMRSIQ